MITRNRWIIRIACMCPFLTVMAVRVGTDTKRYVRIELK